MKRLLGNVALGAAVVFLIVMAVRFGHRATRDSAAPNEGAKKIAVSATPSSPKLGVKAEPTNSTGVARVAQPTVPNLSPTVLTAIGHGEKKGFRSRLQAVEQLGTRLSMEERQALYEYLRDIGEEKWLRPGQGFALKNDILNVLREQQPPPEELTDFLVALRADKSQPLVMRDYAIQHLAPWFAKTDAEQKQKITRELLSAARETDQSYAGTALLALQRIQQENPNAELSPFTNQIARLIEDGTANLLARITAVQLSAQLGLTEALESVNRLAADESQPETLRIAAVGAIARSGRVENASLLKKLADGGDERMKHAATVALRNLSRAGGD